MEKLTVGILNERFGFNFIPNSHTLMSDGKGCIIDVYGKPFKINGDNVETVEQLENKLALFYGSEEKPKKSKTVQSDKSAA